MPGRRNRKHKKHHHWKMDSIQLFCFPIIWTKYPWILWDKHTITGNPLRQIPTTNPSVYVDVDWTIFFSSPATAVSFAQELLQVPVAHQSVGLFLRKGQFQHFSIQPIHPDVSHSRGDVLAEYDVLAVCWCFNQRAARSSCLACIRPPRQTAVRSKQNAIQEPTNNVFDKDELYHDILMYLLHTMPTIAPEHHYVLMREVDMSAALHATDRPAKQQLSPTKCNARAYQCVWQRRVIPWYPYVLVTYYAYNCTWTPLCIDAWSWYVSCLACIRPPRQTAVESKQCNARAYQCVWQRTIIKWYNLSQMKLSTKVSNSREATLCQKRAEQLSPCHPNSCNHLAMNVWQRPLIPWYNLSQERNAYTKTLCYALLCAHMASDIPACTAFAPNNITYRQCSCNTAFDTEHHTLGMFRWYIWFQ